MTKRSRSKPHLRMGVVVAVRHRDGRLLAFERSDVTGEWQLPQGGVEAGESLVDAAWRELAEETGLDERHVELAGEHEAWTAYVWPESVQRGERRGQAHRWFFFEPIVDELEPRPDGTEFRAWRWMWPAELIESVVDFRKQPYRQVLGEVAHG